MSIYSANNRYAFPVAYYARALPDFSMPVHTHHRCEIMCLVSGSCRVEADGQMLRLQERQLIFIDQDVPHRLQVDTGSPCVLLNFEFSCSPHHKGIDLHRLAERQAEVHQFLDRPAPWQILLDTGKVGYALKDLIDELEKRKPDNDLLTEILLVRLLIELARSMAADVTASGIRHIRKAVQYIVGHLYEDLSVRAVSHAVGVNHSYLQKLFSEHFQCGIMGYINGQRLEHAAFLLRNSSMNVIDIAFHIGYNSRQHFSYLFQKQFGVRPQVYRTLNSRQLNPDTAGSQHEAGLTVTIHPQE
jgi:AraC family transcriptional regulator, melibiose operon regulatory protein